MKVCFTPFISAEPTKYIPKYSHSLVIHVILSTTSGVAEIPPLLASSQPSRSTTDNIGSQNYTKPPQAVVTGAGYDEEAVETMRKACDTNGQGSKVPWLRPDTSIPTPPLGPKYGEAMTKRVKVCLRELEEEGRMGGDGVYFY